VYQSLYCYMMIRCSAVLIHKLTSINPSNSPTSASVFLSRETETETVSVSNGRIKRSLDTEITSHDSESCFQLLPG